MISANSFQDLIALMLEFCLLTDGTPNDIMRSAGTGISVTAVDISLDWYGHIAAVLVPECIIDTINFV
jgi:hypothetical protein